MRWMMLAVMALSVSACGGGDGGACGGEKVGGNSLDGSYCEGLDMLFTGVRLKVQESGDSKFVTIDYLYADEATTTPLKTLTILFDAGAVMVEENKQIPILQASGVVRRIDRDMTINLTDQLESDSQVTFSDYSGDVGSDTAGSFGLLFKNGRTLLGTFEGPLVDARDTVDG
ncbi:MAG: hypothetical protein RKU31_16150 [Deltaproteobacteria bacterium]|jgi:hypothetical protein